MSIKYEILNGQFVWVVMFFIGLLGFWSTVQLSNVMPENNYAPVPSEEEEECEMEELDA